MGSIEDKRNPLLRNPNHTALIIMDMQLKILNPIPDKEAIIENSAKLRSAFRTMNIEVIYTEQNPNKLGSTIGDLKPSEGNLIARKMDFSCSNCTEIDKRLKQKNISNIVLCGIETHICILQSAIDLKFNNYEVYLPVNATGSRHQVDHDIAIKRMSKSGIHLTTFESIIFELCKSANKDIFKNIIKLVKN